MAIDKSIFDDFQKSLLDKKYINLDKPETIVYQDETEPIQPMTDEEYAEMEGALGSSLAIEQEFESSAGLTEQVFSQSAQTFTSFHNSINSLRETYLEDNNTEFEFTNSATKLTFVEDLVMSSVQDISPTEAVLGGIFQTLSDVVALIPSITSILLTAASAIVEIGGGIVEGAVGVVSGAAKAVAGFGKNL